MSELRLVYPPISNQEGDWLASDEEVKDQVKESKFYMIGQRKELLFVDFSYDENARVFHFKLKMMLKRHLLNFWKVNTTVSNLNNIQKVVTVCITTTYHDMATVLKRTLPFIRKMESFMELLILNHAIS